MTAPAPVARRLTHVELLYRPGERDKAVKVLALLGCEPLDRGGHWFTAFVDPAAGEGRDYSNNVFYASEVSAAQWELEQALCRGLPDDRQAYVDEMRRDPQHSAHFGFRVGDRAALDAVLDRVRAAADSDPDLRGRVAVDGVFEPDAPDAIATTMVQAFIWTDVVASGLLALGQHIEVQLHLTSPNGSAA
jgi:hypothetical protein